MCIALIVVPFVFVGGCSLLVDDVSDDVIDDTDEELYYLLKSARQAKPPCSSDTIPLSHSCSLTTALGQQRFNCYMLQ